jgi:hypothetical protein
MEIRTIQPFLKYFENIRGRTIRVAQYIPPEKSIGPVPKENSRSGICCGT